MWGLDKALSKDFTKREWKGFIISRWSDWHEQRREGRKVHGMFGCNQGANLKGQPGCRQGAEEGSG